MNEQITEDFLAYSNGRNELRDWAVLMAYRGSIAHGTFIPSDEPDAYDDIDLIGVAVPPMEYYTGLKTFGSRGTVEVQEGPWDTVVYEHQKTVRLLMKGNPNLLSLLFLPDELFLWKRPAGQLLLEHSHLFATQRAYPAFRGYAQGQLRKMFNGAYQGYMGEKRKELVDRYGYDVKQASHLIRILRQGIEFMKDGRFATDRTDVDAEELIAIKQGRFSLNYVEARSQTLELELEAAGAASTLPLEPNRELCNSLAVAMADAQLRCGV